MRGKKIFSMLVATSMLIVFSVLPVAAASSSLNFDNGCRVVGTNAAGNGRVPSVAGTRDDNGQCGQINVKLRYKSGARWRTADSGYQNQRVVSVLVTSPDIAFSDHNIKVRDGLYQGYRIWAFT